jgi:hypothetical protein
VLSTEDRKLKEDILVALRLAAESVVLLCHDAGRVSAADIDVIHSLFKVPDPELLGSAFCCPPNAVTCVDWWLCCNQDCCHGDVGSVCDAIEQATGCESGPCGYIVIMECCVAVGGYV